MDKETETALIVLSVLGGAIFFAYSFYKCCCKSPNVRYSVLEGRRLLRAQQQGEFLHIAASPSVMHDFVKGNEVNVTYAAMDALNKVDPRGKQRDLTVKVDLGSPLLKK